jgi:mRNA-degrading endonuclease toxin of MazEF toxin-antitoxin module
MARVRISMTVDEHLLAGARRVRSGVRDAARSVSVETLVERLGRLSGARMREICGALEVAVACEG